MIKNSVQYPHVKRIFFILTTLLLVIGFTIFLVKNRNFKTHAYSPDLFVTTWQTDVTGATEPNKVTLRFLKVATDTYEVSWNCDDDYELFYTSLATHNYPTPGTYDVCVRSTAPLRFYSPDLATDEKAKLLEIKQWGTIPWSSFMSAFKDMVNMQLTATDIPDLSQVTDMSSAFQGATNFTGNDSMDSWNTSGVKNMAATFSGASNFNAPIGNWDTSAVTAMNSMFGGATNFNQYIGKWKTGEVGNMSLMFFEATNFNNGEAPGESTKPLEWNTSKAFNFKQMFNKAYSFNQDISGWQTGLVRDMYGMFAGATVFNQDIGGWNTSEVINMGSMFNQASVFNQNIGSWNTGAVTNMSNMFRQATAFNNGDAPGESQNTMNWVTTKVESMSLMFRDASAFNQYIGGWDTGVVTNMSNMFQGATVFNNGEAPGESSNTMNWDTKSLQYVTYMFLNAKAFNQNIGSWNTSNITSTFGMFMSASSFNQNLNNWDTKKVTSMMHMFNGATVFNNGDVAGGSSNPLNWDTSKVDTMYAMFVARDFNQPFGPKWTTANVRNMSDMFRQARSFNQYIGDWNTAKVENMAFMFQNANVFNNGAEPGDESKPLNWNTTQVKSMAAMFNYAYQFNQPFGDSWNTANVTNMTRMFDRAAQFNQDISSWNISKVEYFNQFLNASNMQIDNYDSLLNAWSVQTVKPSRTFDAVGVNYCYAEDARTALMGDPSKWTINDAGKKCPPQNLSLSPDEIEENKTEVGTITSEAEGAVIYSLVSGEGSGDNSKFALNPTTGALAFLEPPDYENPTGTADPDDKNKYTIRVRATDSTNLYTEEIFVITVLDVDDLPPEITINQGTTMSNAPITDTTFKVSDRFSIASVEVDESSIATADNIVCTPPFPYEADPPDPENHIEMNCTIRIKTSGRLVLKATDNAGLSSTAFKDGYVVDQVPPTFITSSIDTLTHGIDKPIIEFEATDAVGMLKYEIKYVGSDGLNKVDEIEYTKPGVIQRTLELYAGEDQHTITVIAYDLVGNTTEKQTIFPPEVVFNAPTILSNQPINNSTVTITAPIAGHEIDNIAISGTASEGVTLENCADADGEHNAPYTTYVTCNIRNINKSGTIIIQAEDTNNGATGYNSHMYTIDTVDPVITINAPTKKKKDNITDTTITVTDAVEIYPADIEIAASSTGMAENLECTADTGDKNIINCTITIIESGNLAITAKDQAGNSITETKEGYIIDRIPPAISITSTAPINRANRTHYTLGGTCTFGDNNIITVIAEQPYVAECQSDDTWSTELDLSAQPDGTVVVYASQTDDVGNKGEDTKELLKDTIAPVVGYEDLSTNNPSPELTGTVNDKNATVQVVIVETGQIINATNNQNGTWTVSAGDITNLTTKTYNLTITATDTAQNSSEITGQLIIDITPPYITSIVPATGQPNPTNQQPIIFHVTFSEPLKDDTLDANSFKIKEDGVVTTAKVTEVTSINNKKYALSVSGIVNQKASITVFSPAHTYQDVLGNWNTAEIESSTVTFDKEKPTVTVNQADDQVDPTNINSIKYTVVFSKPINGDTFVKEDLLISGSSTATISQLQTVNSTTYTAVVTGMVSGETVSLFLPANRVEDSAGNTNTASTSTDNSVTYDATSPTVTVNQADDQADPTNEDIIKFTIIFSEPINEDTFTRDDLEILGSSTAKVLLLTNVNNTTYTAYVNGMVSGETVSLILPVDTVEDLAGNKNIASTSIDNSITYDNTPPSVTINQSSTQTDPTDINSIKYTVIFSKPIKEDTFTNEDILISGSTTAQVKSITKISETEYEVEIENLTNGETVTATIPADVLTDLAGNTNVASTSTDNSVTYIVEEEEEPEQPEEEEEEPPKPIIPTPLDPKPIVKPKNPFTKYINPIIETEQEEDTKAEEETVDITKEPTPPTQSKSLKIKVYNESGEPLVGVTVEIHSDVRTGITDENGEVYFENLETGLHTMVISYNGYRAEKKINLISDGAEEMEINVKVEKVIIPTYVYWLIALIVLLTILLGYNIYKRKQVEKK
ncbi:BspA family leucine-rich repeat surface protein [Candidatus Dojkabacteria bacterium]|nr:BspA family leucine-rich repeat surface protein [Candidatus Dojkabacteria bacterium]